MSDDVVTTLLKRYQRVDQQMYIALERLANDDNRHSWLRHHLEQQEMLFEEVEQLRAENERLRQWKQQATQTMGEISERVSHMRTIVAEGGES